MTPFEYLLALISVLVGLAIADVSTTLHRLLRARRRVRWDWLPLLAALLALLVVLEFWWTLFNVTELGYRARLVGFLPLAAQLVLLFLLNAAALPDDVPEQGLDLREFYEENRSYFWTLYALFLLSTILLGTAERAMSGAWSAGDLLRAQIPNLVVLASFILLARTRRRWVHGTVMSLWLVVFLWSWWGHRLGSG